MWMTMLDGVASIIEGLVHYIRNIEYSYGRQAPLMYGLKERAMQDSLRRFKADIFQALAHPTRLAIIENLEQGELSAGELQEKLNVEQANLSQHLAVLRTKQLVVNRKAGNQVFYSVRDPIILKVLALMRRYFYTHLQEAMELLGEMVPAAESEPEGNS